MNSYNNIVVYTFHKFFDTLKMFTLSKMEYCEYFARIVKELLFCLFRECMCSKNVANVRIKLTYQTTEYSAREMWHENREARIRHTLNCASRVTHFAFLSVKNSIEN